MSRRPSVLKTARIWSALNRELVDLAADGSPELMTLSRDDLASVRAQAHDLVQALDAWCAAYRPTPTTYTKGA